MKNRSLSLRGDRLGELTSEELSTVAGAGISILPCIAISGICPLIPTWDCTGCHITCTC